MLKRIFCLTTLLFIFEVNGFYQVGAAKASPDLFYYSTWDFYSENNVGARVWGMGGAGVANVNDLTAMVINPAALTVKERISLYGEILTKNRSQESWYEQQLQGFPTNFESPVVLPDFVGLGFRISRKVNLGFLASKTMDFDFGKGGIGIPSTGFFDFYAHFRARQILLPVRFKVTEGLHFGANLNYNFIFVKRQTFNMWIPGLWKGKSNVDYWNFKMGILYHPFNKLDLGVTFVPQKSFSTETEWNVEDTTFVMECEKTTIPWELAIGFCLHNLTHSFRNLALDIKYSNNSVIDWDVDRLDFHLGVEIEASKEISILLGYFTRFDYRVSEGWNLTEGELDQHFLTAGLSIKIQRFLIQTSLRNSSLLSEGFMDQTHFSVGTGFHF
jgi:hypothetical protein